MSAKSDTSLFIYHHGSETVYLLLYVDDIVLTASCTSLLRRVIDALQLEFSMKDLGSLHQFLGLYVTRQDGGFLLSRRQYILEVLQRAGMAECHSTTTPVDTHAKLSATAGAPVVDLSAYRSLAGALQYLTLTHPDLAYTVQ